jgi:hypothetical protein
MCPVGPPKFGTEGIIALFVFSLPFFEAIRKKENHKEIL